MRKWTAKNVRLMPMIAYQDLKCRAAQIEEQAETIAGLKEWHPESKPPEMGLSVLGYHPAWVDLDFCPDGIRCCFLYGDGTQWQSAVWDGCQDCWQNTEEKPAMWKARPEAPILAD